MISATNVYRACAHPGNEHWQACESRLAFGCFFCKEPDCNSHALYRNATIKCVVCQGEECKTKTALTQCTEHVYYSNPQYCFYAMLGGTVLEKGCGPSGPTGPSAPKDVIVTACMGDGCNMELPLTYSACAHYKGPDRDVWKRTMEQCHDEKSLFWHPGCYYTWDYRSIYSGCLSDLDHNQLRACTRKEYKDGHCQYCLGEECNMIPLRSESFLSAFQRPN